MNSSKGKNHLYACASFLALLTVLLFTAFPLLENLDLGDDESYSLVAVRSTQTSKASNVPSEEGVVDVLPPSERLIFRNKQSETIEVPLAEGTERTLEFRSFLSNGQYKSKTIRYTQGSHYSSLNGEYLGVSGQNGEILLSDDGIKFEKLDSKMMEPFHCGMEMGGTKGQFPKASKSLKRLEISNQEPKFLPHSDEGKAREIEVLFLLSDDFSIGLSDEQVTSEVLRIVFQSNQFLSRLNLKVVVRGINMYETDSAFSSSLTTRDAFGMLSQAVIEGQKNSTQRDVVAVLSKTYFPAASGLAYTNTSCVNPVYSVLFATSGGGKGASGEQLLAVTLAHELGHTIGMMHDDSFYPAGLSLMASSYVLKPFGFSDLSSLEQANFSGRSLPGGLCLSEQGSSDSDGDGASDELELLQNSNPFDFGSVYPKASKSGYVPWNSYIDQMSVAESQLIRSTGLNHISARGVNWAGQEVGGGAVEIESGTQFDFLTSDLTTSNSQGYGYVRLDSSENLRIRSLNYGISPSTRTLKFVTGGEVLSPQKQNTPAYILFNTHVPTSFTNTAAVLNWLSIVNLAETPRVFRVKTLSRSGFLIRERNIAIPALGRVDVEADISSSPLKTGIEVVEPLIASAKDEYLVFLNRYYYSITQAKQGQVLPYPELESRVLLPARHATGASQYFVQTVDTSPEYGLDVPNQAWIEIANTQIRSVTAVLKAIRPDGSLIFERGIEIGPYAQEHLLVPINESYLLELSSLQRESLIATGLKYSRVGSHDRVSQLSLTQAFSVESQVSGVNTFLGTDNKLIVGNPSGVESMLSCYLNSSQGKRPFSRNISKARVASFDIKELVPEIKPDSYYALECSLKDASGSPVPGILSVERLVAGVFRISIPFH